MTHESHGWDDDEETIINFTPKPRSAQPRLADNSVPPYPQDVFGLSAIHAPSGMVTPPSSESYGMDSSISGTNPLPDADDEIAKGAQDPYLATAGVHDALPSVANSAMLTPPPLPPLPDIAHLYGRVAEHGTPPATGIQPLSPEPLLPGFAPPRPMSDWPRSEVTDSAFADSPLPLPPIAPELPWPAPQAGQPAATDTLEPVPGPDIDPPTIMDVPLTARRALEAAHPTESAPTADERFPRTDGELRADESVQSVGEVASLVGAQVPAAGQTSDGQAAGSISQLEADREWVALCEAAVAPGGVLRAPITSLSDGIIVSAAPVAAAPDQLGTSREFRDAPAPVQPEDAPDRAAPLPSYPEPADAEFDREREMERTNLHLPVRAAETVAELAWLIILKSPSAHIHQMYRLDAIRMEMGRTFDAPIFVDDKTVSSRHAAIRYERANDGFEFVLYDLASTNGTFVNGAAVHTAVLKDDDRIRIGETELAFKKVGDPPAGPR